VLLRKVIKTSGTATMGEAFVGVTRLRLAVEAAARSNIQRAWLTSQPWTSDLDRSPDRLSAG
jgi:hypothetical protein